MVTPLVRPAGTARDYDELQAVYADVLNVQYMDRSIAGAMYIGTVNATTIVLGGVATGIQIPGTLILLDSSTLVVNSGTITLGDNDGDSITLGGGLADSVTLAADMGINNDADVRFTRGGPGTSVFVLPDASVGEVGAIRVDPGNNFQWWNGAAWATAGAATPDTLQQAYEAGNTITTNGIGGDLVFTVSVSGDFDIRGLAGTYWHYDYTAFGVYADALLAGFDVQTLAGFDINLLSQNDLTLQADDDILLSYDASSINGTFYVSSTVGIHLTMDQLGEVFFTPGSGEDFVVQCTGAASGAMDFSTNDADIDFRAGIGGGSLGSINAHAGGSVEIDYRKNVTSAATFTVKRGAVDLIECNDNGRVTITPTTDLVVITTGITGNISMVAGNDFHVVATGDFIFSTNGATDFTYDSDNDGDAFTIQRFISNIVVLDGAGQITLTPEAGQDFNVGVTDGDIVIQIDDDTNGVTAGSFLVQKLAAGAPTGAALLSISTDNASTADATNDSTLSILANISNVAGQGESTLNLDASNDGLSDATVNIRATAGNAAAGEGSVVINAVSTLLPENHFLFLGRNGGYGGFYGGAFYTHAAETARWRADVDNAGGGPSLYNINVTNTGGANADFKLYVTSSNGSTCTALIDSRDHVYIDYNSNALGAGDFELRRGGVAVLTADSAGAVSVTPISGQHFTVTTAGVGEIRFTDGFLPVSWALGHIPLSSNAGEWVAFEAAFGEVSLLNSITQAGVAAVAVSLDVAYNQFGANPATVVVDNAEGQGDVTWDLTGDFSFNIDLSNTTNAADGFQVYDTGAEYFRLIRKGAATIDLESQLQSFTLTGSASSTIQTTGGDVILTAAGDITTGSRIVSTIADTSNYIAASFTQNDNTNDVNCVEINTTVSQAVPFSLSGSALKVSSTAAGANWAPAVEIEYNSTAGFSLIYTGDATNLGSGAIDKDSVSQFAIAQAAPGVGVPTDIRSAVNAYALSALSSASTATLTAALEARGETATIGATTAEIVGHITHATAFSPTWAIVDSLNQGTGFAYARLKAEQTGTAGNAELVISASSINGTAIIDIDVTGTFDVLATTNFSIDGATASNVTVSGATADLTLGARGTTITLNELGDTALVGYTATSIIGALNEAKTNDTWQATSGEAIAVGEAVCGPPPPGGTADSVYVASADSTDTGRQYCIGFAVTAAGAPATALEIRSTGLMSVICPTGQAWTMGDAIFLDDSAPGQVTNVVPVGVGDVVQQVGWAAETNSTLTPRTMFIALSKVIPVL